MDPIAAGAAANISSETAMGIFHEAKRHIRYLVFYQRYVKNFEDKLQKLIEKRLSVQQDIVVAERNVQKIKADVQGWGDRVDKVIREEKDKVKNLQDKANNKSFFGFCPNIKSRHKLSRKAEEDAATFDELIKECQFNSVGYLDLPQLIVDTDFEAFKSRERVFNDIVESLKDFIVSMIGVYGMPGVGKTSLVKEVERQLQEAKLFNSVVMVTVSQTPDIQKIRDEIAESSGLRIEEKSTVVRATRLRERLIQGKDQTERVLIILDDIWKKLDLAEVGIPFGSQHKGCKILLTSRNKTVLSNGMGATKTFQLGDLEDEEAWEFFKKMAGDSFESDRELKSTAIEVAKRCAGLSIAIATVARALQKQSLFVWNEALRQLQRPYSENPSEISAEVYSAIELSINHLRGEDLKQVFLLCSLLRRDTTIEDLLRYKIGLGLINGVDTVKEARDSLLTMMSTLKASCLLLDSNTNDEFFDVHDLTYIVAKSMASKDNQVFALREEDVLIDWPDAESMKKCSKISMIFP
ncbi:probable disease resistance protein At5g63020 [Hibiscus syriacus]|uniref:probable disease resistance protein At5g63020 n=1 Tax=Hibiscus syriacus TaxID=106335 RepID=UPI001925050F|nr:probable disease resistance protein At5g63020 [Hibiscus syriacus]